MSKSLEHKLELTRQLTIRKSRVNFFTFLKYMFPNPDVTWNWHHREVCNLLQEFIIGDIDNLMVFMPPQHQKSTMMTEYLPAWLFGVNPNAESLLVMYNATMAAKYNRKIQRIIDSEKYAEIFPNTKLNAKNIVTSAKGSYVRNSDEFEIVGHRGFLKTVGVGGGIAGNPAKFTFMDDVIKNVAEASSVVYRNKIYDWMTDELEARQHNDSKIAFTITRRHEDDLAGRLIKRDGKVEDGGKWHVVVLPALMESEPNEIDKREIGEALFPALHSKKRMEYIRDKNPRTFSGLYQQRPTSPEGNIIKRKDFLIKDFYELPESIRNSVKDFVADTAFTKNQKNDPSAVIPYYAEKGYLFIFDYLNVRQEFPKLKKTLERYAYEWGDPLSSFKIEPKANGLSVIQELKEVPGLNVSKHKMLEGDKISRLNAVSAKVESGRVVLVRGAWNEKFINEICAFPNGKHDEAVDLLIMAIVEGLVKSQKINWTGKAAYKM